MSAGDPTRAGGVAGSTARARPLFGRLGVSVLTASVAVALVIGAFIGSGLSSFTASRTEDAALIDAYYNAFSQTDIDRDWESVVAYDEEGKS
jgi:hypothetical protein